jgi:hypothetical protein
VGITESRAVTLRDRSPGGTGSSAEGDWGAEWEETEEERSGMLEVDSEGAAGVCGWAAVVCGCFFFFFLHARDNLLGKDLIKATKRRKKQQRRTMRPSTLHRVCHTAGL